MPIRLRKLIGAVALIVLVIVWSLVAMALAQTVLTSISGLTAAIYYVMAGLGWVLPAMPLIRWTTDDGGRMNERHGGDNKSVLSRLSSVVCYAAFTRRKPFHTAVADPDSNTRR